MLQLRGIGLGLVLAAQLVEDDGRVGEDSGTAAPHHAGL